MVIYQAGPILGIFIIIFYALAAMNYVIKLLYRKWASGLKRDGRAYRVFAAVMRFLVRNHRFFGILAVFMLLLHFSLQFYLYGLSITGIIAGALMATQFALGVYGFKSGGKGTLWLAMHRTVAAILVIAVAVHIV